MTFKILHVHGDTGYPVYIGNENLGDTLPGLLSAFSRIYAVTDENVFSFHKEKILTSLPAGTEMTVLRHGEVLKSTENLVTLWNAFAAARLDRRSVVVAFGGGTVGDLCGFAAATYMRGIAYIQVPTTLLAMTDSSIGGKTAVDTAAGKNLVGTFFRPSAVVADLSFLSTLPDRETRSAFGEIIKYSFITKNALPILLQAKVPDMPTILVECIRAKAALVEADEFDRGPRIALNFGHTIGHAAEQLSGYRFSHGECVVFGCLAVLRGCIKRGLCPDGFYEEFLSLARRFSRVADISFSADEIAKVLHADKKTYGNTFTFVYPSDRSISAYLSVPEHELHAFLSDCLAP